MSKTYDLIEIINIINTFQNMKNVHPLTCENDSSHGKLIPIVDDRKNIVILSCRKCGYIQGNIPQCVFDVVKLERESNIDIPKIKQPTIDIPKIDIKNISDYHQHLPGMITCNHCEYYWLKNNSTIIKCIDCGTKMIQCPRCGRHFSLERS